MAIKVTDITAATLLADVEESTNFAMRAVDGVTKPWNDSYAGITSDEAIASQAVVALLGLGFGGMWARSNVKTGRKPFLGFLG